MAADASYWTFNVVYTPGSVIYLLPFVETLTRFSPASFRLVDNGCLPIEKRLLRRAAELFERCSFYSVSERQCLEHGEVLNRLLVLDTPGPFCFLDSDIVASGQFLEPLMEAFEGAPAIFSAPPIWLPEYDGIFKDGMQTLSGEYIFDSEGRAVGGTYLAVYDRNELAIIQDRFGIGFEPVRWADIAPDLKAFLNKKNRCASTFSTGKLLNACFENTRFVEIEALHHIGGFSFVSTKHTHELNPLKLGTIKSYLKVLRAAWNYRSRGEWQEVWLIAKRRVLFRNPVRDFFLTYLRSRAQKKTPPKLPITSCPKVNIRIRKACDAIELLEPDPKLS